MADKKSTNVVAMMEEWFSKLPSLPKNWQEVIVKVTPWIALIFGVLGVLVSLVGVGLLTALAPFVLLGGGIGRASGGIIGAVLALVSSVLLLAAFPGTKKGQMGGWKMLFYSEVVSLVSALVAISPSGVLGSAIGFYILFQIKSYYK